MHVIISRNIFMKKASTEKCIKCNSSSSSSSSNNKEAVPVSVSVCELQSTACACNTVQRMLKKQNWLQLYGSGKQTNKYKHKHKQTHIERHKHRRAPSADKQTFLGLFCCFLYLLVADSWLQLFFFMCPRLVQLQAASCDCDCV